MSSVSALGHNGTLLVVYPLDEGSEIMIDGDLSDWPDGLERHAISQLLSPVTEGAEIDLVEFRIVWKPEEEAVYIAMEYRDDHFTPDDLLTLTIDQAHKRMLSDARQFLWSDGRVTESKRSGNFAAMKGVEVVTTEKDGLRISEWKIQLDYFGAESGSDEEVGHRAFGLDVDFHDFDHGLQRSWTGLGVGSSKQNRTLSVGDAWLLSRGAHLVPVKIDFPDKAKTSAVFRKLTFNIIDTERPGFDITVGADKEFKLPPGSYRVKSQWGRLPTQIEIEVAEDDPFLELYWPFEFESCPTEKVDWTLLPYKVPNRLSKEFIGYGVADGFLTNQGMAIDQATDGAVWFVAESSLSRLWQGQVWSMESSRENWHDGYVGMAIDPISGVVCVTSRRGSFLIEGDEMREFGLAQGLSLNWVRPHLAMPIVPWGEGNGFWLGHEEGLVRLSTSGEIENVPFHGRINGMVLGEQGALWVAAQFGLYKVESGVVSACNDIPELPNKSAISICKDVEGVLWIAYFQDGVWRFDPSNGEARQVLSPSDFESDSRISHLSWDTRVPDQMWVGCARSHSLRSFRKQVDGKFIQTRLIKEAGGVRDVFRDSDETLWVIGDERLLGSVPEYLEPIEIDKSYPSQSVKRMVIDKKANVVWVGTKRGLIRMGPEERWFGKSDGLPRENISELYFDPQGMLWVGTSKGLAKWDGERFRTWGQKEGLLDSHITSLMGDDGGLWIGTMHGLNLLREGEMVSFGKKDGLPGLEVKDIAVTGDGEVLVAYGQKRIARYVDGGFVPVQGFNGQEVNVLERATDGSVWVGGIGTELAVYRRGSFIFPEPDEVSSVTRKLGYRCLAFDESGKRYAGHKDGIALSDGRVLQLIDNLSQGRGAVEQVALGGQNKRLYLICGDKLYSHQIAKTKPRIFLDNGPGSAGDLIKGLDSAASLPIQVAGHSTKGDPADLVYRYRLDGGDWEYTRDRRLILKGLSLGEHDVVVQCVDRNLNYSDILGLKAKISRDFPRLFLITFAFIGVGLGLVQIGRILDRKRLERRRQIELNMLVKERTNELNQANQRLEHRYQMSALLSEISTEFINMDPVEVDEAIPLALGRIGRILKVDRVSIYSYREEEDVFELIYEWFGEAFAPVAEEMRSVRLSAFPWLKLRYLDGEPIIIDSQSDLPEDAVPEREMFRVADRKSVAVIPLRLEGRVIGHLGFSSMVHQFTFDHLWIDDLRTAGEVFAGTLSRRRRRLALRKLRQDAASAEERERTRISRELHDQLGGALTGLRIHSKALGMQLGSENSSLTKEVNRMTEIIDEALPDVRRICSELRPAVLDDLDLSEAIEWMASRFNERTGIRCKYDFHQEKPFDSVHERDVALYRICQELLTNVIRHSEASRVEITLAFRSDDFISLTVKDNGIGAEQDVIESKEDRFGLRGIYERAEHLGGSVELKSSDGGLTVVVLIPIRVPSMDIFSRSV